MSTTQAYCVYCNKKNKKGEWKKTDILNPYVDVKFSSKGHRKWLTGICAVCHHKVTSIISSNPNKESENANNNSDQDSEE